MFFRQPGAGRRLRILIVEDHARIRELEREGLTHLGFEVVTAGTAEEALRLLDKTPYDLLLTDVRLPGTLDGIGLACIARQRVCHMKTLVVGAHLDRYPTEEFSAIADDSLRKPFTLSQLNARVVALIGSPRDARDE